MSTLQTAGYALRWGDRATFRAGWDERFIYGAFTDSLEPDFLKRRPIHLLLNHDQREVFASTADGSLTLRETPTGLRYEAEIREPRNARIVRALIEAGELRNVSVGFRALDQQEVPRHRPTSKLIFDAWLSEISLCKDGCYSRSSVFII